MNPLTPSMPSVRTTVYLAGIALVAGCASQPTYTPYRPVASGTVIDVDYLGADVEAPDAESSGEAAARDAAVGAGAGAVAGAYAGLMAGAICGPLMIICSPAMALVGAGAGAIVGGIGGSIAGSIRGVPAEKAEAFEAAVAAALDSRNPHQALSDEFAANVGERWRVAEDNPRIRLELSLESLGVAQPQNDQLALILETGVIVWSGPDLAERSRKFRFTSRSPQRLIDDWLADDAALVEESLSRSYRESALEMIAALEP